MTDREVLIGFVSTVFGGVVVWIIQQIYLNRKEKRKELESSIIKPKQISRSIDRHAIESLTPGSTIELMRELLGAPQRQARSDYPVFKGKEVKTHSYIYNFKNALLKITSKDNKIIDSLTVFGEDDKIYHEMLEFFSDEQKEIPKLGKAKINKELIKNCTKHDIIRGCRNYSFAVSVDIPNPYYMTFTYFGYPDSGDSDYEETQNPESFIGSTIDGFCISDNSDNVYFIYDEELR
jgi:hypothetical protein